MLYIECTGFGVSFRFPRSREVIGLNKKTTNLVLLFELQKAFQNEKIGLNPQNRILVLRETGLTAQFAHSAGRISCRGAIIHRTKTSRTQI